jgi:hypothetical protein
MGQPVGSTIERFLAASDFMGLGGVMTDLDGTALHEERGRVFVSVPMETGLQRMSRLARPVVLNTLRFPLSVIRTFGKEWYAIARVPVPLVSLRGSLCGRLVQLPDGELGFEEFDATCLTDADISQVLSAVSALVDAGLDRLLVFFYPRDWRVGELIWTPTPARCGEVAAKYRSAARVITGDLAVLERELRRQPVCMVFRLIDIPQDQAMAYQHTERSSFYTAVGVDKRYGAQRIGTHLGIDLGHSIGAGDSPMDDFLSAVGLAVIVGDTALPFSGKHGTLRVPHPKALGELLQEVADAAERLHERP